MKRRERQKRKKRSVLKEFLERGIGKVMPKTKQSPATSCKPCA